MKYMMKSWVLKFCLFFVLCTPFCVSGQDAKILSEEMELIFKTLRPVDRAALLEDYVSVMTGSFLDVEEKQIVDSIFRDLQKLRVSVSPELKNYILCVNAFCKREEKENLKVWLQGLQSSLLAEERKRTIVKEYLLSTFPLASQQFLFDGAAHKWQIKGAVKWSGKDSLLIEFNEVDLYCMTRKDTIRIFTTTGNYRIGDGVFNANGGKVIWPNTADEMTVTLNRYKIELRSSFYMADSVYFNYESKYHRSIFGKLKDNALKYTRDEKTPFPEFISYDTDVEIKDLCKDAYFRGGITYHGVTFSGTGTEESPALLHITPNDSISLKLYSKKIIFDSLRIMAGRAAMEIILDSGMITHSDINFLYSVPKHTVTIKRMSEQSTHLPFKDSYHQILFDMEEIYWPLAGDHLEMRMSSRTGLFKATIESMNFFSNAVYDHIQGMDEMNPLNALLKCSIELGANTFSLGEYACFMEKQVGQLRKQIILLSYDDFVDYNETRDEVTLKQRLFDYTKARVNKQDYDNIRFTSLPGKDRVNAVMNVRNYNLKIRGVEKLLISEERNIFFVPSNQEVLLMKDRDMSFNGKLNAGMFDVFGQNLFFSYENYAIALPKVDSASMYTSGYDKNVRGEKIGSLFHYITGEIIIDKPDNKSGKKDDPGYPILNSTEDSYVYFDAPHIQNGQYKRDSFYYRIDPYKIRGINDASRFRYVFSGTLISNIVTPINDSLRLLEDNTLGMNYQTPHSGVALYNKGRVNSRIILDQNGFVANGKVEMNKTEFSSDSILMLPQQLLADTREISVDSIKGKRPMAYGKDVRISYLRKDGSLQATSTSKSLDLYGGRVKHEGTLFVYESLLDASGKLNMKEAELHSKLFTLNDVQILSEQTTLGMTSLQNKQVNLKTSDVNVKIDMIANKGFFVNNKSSNQLQFSGSRYNSSFKRFTWYIADAYLNVGIEDSIQLTRLAGIENLNLLPKLGKNHFITTNSLLDSLSFIAPFARYNLKDGGLFCRGINHVDVANGRFYPKKGELLVQANGDIQKFSNGELLCERKDTTKRLADVEFKLKGRNSFDGSGLFTYISEEKKESVIQFTKIGVDTAKLIYAKAIVKNDKLLNLNEGIHFRGDITLSSRQENLYFSGYAGLRMDTLHLKHTWLAFKDFLDSKHIQIPLQVENRDLKYKRIYNAIYLNVDKAFKPYVAFMSTRKFYKDDLLVGGSGEMEWSVGMKQYIISDTVRNKYYRFRYDPELAVVSSQGKINLDLNILGMSQEMAGDISYNLKTERLNMDDVLYSMDFPLLARMESVLLNDFLGDKELKTVSINEKRYEKMYAMCGKSEMENMHMHKASAEKKATLPSIFNRLFVLDSLNLEWKERTRSYTTNGQANVRAIKGQPIEKVMNVKMEFLRSHSSNQYFMYIYNDDLWYYFEFSDKNLYTLSSNDEYNKIIRNEKANEKVIKDEGKTTLYTITLCPDSKKERFLKRVEI